MLSGRCGNPAGRPPARERPARLRTDRRENLRDFRGSEKCADALGDCPAPDSGGSVASHDDLTVRVGGGRRRDRASRRRSALGGVSPAFIRGARGGLGGGAWGGPWGDVVVGCRGGGRRGGRRCRARPPRIVEHVRPVGSRLVADALRSSRCLVPSPTRPISPVARILRSGRIRTLFFLSHGRCGQDGPTDPVMIDGAPCVRRREPGIDGAAGECGRLSVPCPDLDATPSDHAFRAWNAWSLHACARGHRAHPARDSAESADPAAPSSGAR